MTKVFKNKMLQHEKDFLFLSGIAFFLNKRSPHPALMPAYISESGIVTRQTKRRCLLLSNSVGMDHFFN